MDTITPKNDYQCNCTIRGAPEWKEDPTRLRYRSLPCLANRHLRSVRRTLIIARLVDVSPLRVLWATGTMRQSQSAKPDGSALTRYSPNELFCGAVRTSHCPLLNRGVPASAPFRPH